MGQITVETERLGAFTASGVEVAEAWVRYAQHVHSPRELLALVEDRTGGEDYHEVATVIELVVVLADLDRELAMAGADGYADAAANDAETVGAREDWREQSRHMP